MDAMDKWSDTIGCRHSKNNLAHYFESFEISSEDNYKNHLIQSFAFFMSCQPNKIFQQNTINTHAIQ